ncbi:S8 family serine peptidase [Hymenobacter cellulosivorans]|uniref:S8 family serine peptidase n=1 Tax=Hymenobacter cellulosivorans TaxID=2932249 RepID=A0ABY4F6E0_9BACT|nr:S8 family serine peptidase [Hymenobacter cellulosivorans]UOQ51479.1 S8 family serine peptidase [Hymenobacter cellulosivorans]
MATALSFPATRWVAARWGKLLAGAGLVLGNLGSVAPALALPNPPPAARYWVRLRHKAGVQFAPATYFSPAAQARRQRQHLPACDSSDFPVRPDFVRQITATVDSVTLVSRWFNAVACRATPQQVARLRQLPGVLSVEKWEAQTPLVASTKNAAERGSMSISADDQQLARRQTASLGGAAFQRAGLGGQGLRIAIFDVGFLGAAQHPAFQRLLAEKRVVATHDFVKNRPNVFVSGTHGTEVLSCIAGLLPDGTPLGLAPQAEFLLARTERLNREIYAEEEAWLAAAEWADRNGADIINSSLGYTDRRYFPEQMNGRTSLVARAAELAVRKGILVVNAAGNDGDDPDWHRIGTPADADSVLAVGGLDPDTYLHIDFSSYGPSADRRLKPNVIAFGTVLAAAPGGYLRTQGTSFSSPLMAGFAACAWQQNRNLTVMQLFEQLQRCADLYPYFDYAHGYGLPQAAAFLRPAASAASLRPSVDFVRQDSVLAVLIRPEAAVIPAQVLPLYADSVTIGTVLRPGAGPAPGREELAPPLNKPGGKRPAQSQLPSDADPVLVPLVRPGYLYWHVADDRGVLRSYEVREVTQRAVLQIPLRTLRPGDTVRVCYRGITQSYSVQ